MVFPLCCRGDLGRTTAVRGWAGKEAFQCVGDFAGREWDAVERVLTNVGHELARGLAFARLDRGGFAGMLPRSGYGVVPGAA